MTIDDPRQYGFEIVRESTTRFVWRRQNSMYNEVEVWGERDQDGHSWAVQAVEKQTLGGTERTWLGPASDKTDAKQKALAWISKNYEHEEMTNKLSRQESEFGWRGGL